MKLPIHIALGCVHGTLFEADLAPDFVTVSTDTRTLQPGDTFVALHGERYNGHDYVVEAVRRGASTVVIDQPEARVAGAATIMVDRTLTAYMSLARAARADYRGTVVAITGSAGKTTTKVLLAQLLAAKFGARVLAAPANENNEIGVSRLLLSASNDEHDVLVLEMGARRPGDIATLVDVALPDIGVLTNVGEAHLEIMGSREKLEETKWALFGRGARAVLNALDAASVARSASLAQPPHWFAALRAGEDVPPNGRMTALIGTTRAIVSDASGTREYAVDVRLPGAHNHQNLAAALAAASELDVPLAAAIELIPALQLPPGRFESLQIDGCPRIIYDAYNSNPSGVLAALDAFAVEPGERHIAVLGSMAELGGEAEALHVRVGTHAAERADVVLVSGDFAAALASGARAGGLAPECIVEVKNNAQAAQWLREHAAPNDVVLLKASRKYAFEEIVTELQR